MKLKLTKKGSVLVITVFVIAMLSTLIAGMLQMDISEIQLAQHRVYAAQAQALAEAALNEAMAEIRQDSSWTTGFDDKQMSAETKFGGGQYSVDVNDTTLSITASVTSWDGYTATMEAEVTVGATSPHIIRIDSLKINEK